MIESGILRHVMLAATKARAVLFRNNTGQGWIGRAKHLKPGEHYTARGGELLIFDPRPLHAGLFKGSSDLIGWRSIIVSPDMVGKRVAIFMSTETKSAKGRSSDEQDNWLQRVTEAGGIAFICRSAAEFTELLNKFNDG